MTTNIVHVLRHGEVHNPTGVLYGRLPDFHLSERGRDMAARIADHLADAHLTHLVTSPLERARETMAPIAERHPSLEVTIDHRVIEAANAFQGMVFGGDNAALKNPRNWLLLRNPLRPSWGEPYTAIAARMRAAIADAATRAGDGGEALMVSHQLPIWMARCDAEGRRLVHDPRSRECTVASLTSFHFRSGRVVRVSYAEPARDLLREKASSNFSTGV